MYKFLYNLNMDPENTNLNIFSVELAKAFETLSPEDKQHINQAFQKCQNNDRQKLKVIKRILDSNQDTPAKTIIAQKFSFALLQEYLYGSLENKPTMLNIIKNVHIKNEYLLAQQQVIKTFEDCKKVSEILEVLSVGHKIKESDKTQLFVLTQQIYDMLISQMEKGTEMIEKNQFRTKWLESFVQTLRCINYMAKFIEPNQREKVKVQDDSFLTMGKRCIDNSHVLSKQVLTQLFLLVVFLDRSYPFPENPIQKIHYLHASNIIKGENTLLPLLKMGFQIKDTEHKNQLLPILLKSFQQHFKEQEIDENLKTNSFDMAITLFDVGRSIYSYLQEIVDIIILNGGSWNLQGNFTRKFFIARVALKHVETSVIFDMWPTVISECIQESGSMIIPYVTDCAEILLTKLYQENGKNYSSWMQQWIKPYKNALFSEDKMNVRGIIEFINPILLKINSTDTGLLKEILASKDEGYNIQLGLSSLLKCYKQLGKIVSQHEAKLEAKIKEKIGENCYVFVDDPSFTFDYTFLSNLLKSNDSMIACKTLEFLTTSKKPSTLISTSEMKLILEFYRYCLKTSSPEYRKNYLNLTRRMLERFRKIYEKDVTGKNTRKVGDQTITKSTEHFDGFIGFLGELVNLCFENIYPDSIFEIADPALETLLLIVTLFGPEEQQIRKGTFIQPSTILKDKTSFFNMENFQNLVSCLQSSYQSIRSLAHSIIKRFRQTVSSEVESLRKIWKQSIQNTNKLSIKNYEFACRLLTFISNLDCESRNIIPNLPKKYSYGKLNICEFFLNLLRQRYLVFKEQFVDQGQVYYSNLLHGVLTCFSYILDELALIVPTINAQQEQETKQFLTSFFKEIVKILTFAVEVSSANISTVVLDTLASNPQAQKKMKVDCRGHFLPEKKTTVGTYLDSTALISSMENQEQGIENTLVVSFYLLTRQAGLVFQSIGGLVGAPHSTRFVPKEELIDLVNTYFYALINLKHMGSVDRISLGLQKMAKVIFQFEDKELSQMPEKLLNKLLQLLSDGKFTNILRRSAGVPYAFSCLLKSEAVKRKILIEKTVRSLLKNSEQSTENPIQLRIHALNIMKKLFQDSDLRQDLDASVSAAFITSIRGFTSEEWNVRNSSLMLFSVLANKTLGTKPTINLLQFFHKCPDLYQFIAEELSKKKAITMYPPLYPISLLLSRLLPFDLKQKARMTIKGATIKQVRKEELLLMEPLVRAAGDNHNYMGRVMTAKAILPFMELNNIIPHCLDLLKEYHQQLANRTVINNAEHYRLTECFHLIVSYHSIVDSSAYPLLGEFTEETQKQILSTLTHGLEWLHWQKSQISPTVHEIYVKIYLALLPRYFDLKNKNNAAYVQLYEGVVNSCEKSMEAFIKQGCRVIGDLGHSLMYKSFIELLFECYRQLLSVKVPTKCTIFAQYIEILQTNSLKQFDNQILCLLLNRVSQLMKLQKMGEHELQGKLSAWLSSLAVHKLSNDDVLICVLQLFQSLGINSSHQEEFFNSLVSIQKLSENKNLKVAIFQYLLTLYQDVQKEPNQIITEHVHNLMTEYSNPDQLTDLRECCIDFFRKSTKLHRECLIVYVRMLEDEESELRKLTAQRIAEILKIEPLNEGIILEEVLKRLIGQNSGDIQYLKKILKGFMLDSSDYLVRLKNNEEERIFSYDKPNKYRTDINTLVAVIEFLPNPKAIVKELLEEGVTIVHCQKNFTELAEDYRDNVMDRNEYKFETIIRYLITEQPSQHMKKVAAFHPLFERVYKKMLA